MEVVTTAMTVSKWDLRRLWQRWAAQEVGIGQENDEKVERVTTGEKSRPFHIAQAVINVRIHAFARQRA